MTALISASSVSIFDSTDLGVVVSSTLRRWVISSATFCIAFSCSTLPCWIKYFQNFSLQYSSRTTNANLLIKQQINRKYTIFMLVECFMLFWAQRRGHSWPGTTAVSMSCHHIHLPKGVLPFRLIPFRLIFMVSFRVTVCLGLGLRNRLGTGLGSG